MSDSIIHFLLSSDIRGEGSIAIVKKFDFEKSLKVEKLFLIFCPSPNVAPKPTGSPCKYL